MPTPDTAGMFPDPRRPPDNRVNRGVGWAMSIYHEQDGWFSPPLLNLWIFVLLVVAHELRRLAQVFAG